MIEGKFNVERACMIAYLDCLTDNMRKTLDENNEYDYVDLLTPDEVVQVQRCMDMLVRAISRIQTDLSYNDPNYATIPKEDQ